MAIVFRVRVHKRTAVWLRRCASGDCRRVVREERTVSRQCVCSRFLAVWLSFSLRAILTDGHLLTSDARPSITGWKGVDCSQTILWPIFALKDLLRNLFVAFSVLCCTGLVSTKLVSECWSLCLSLWCCNTHAFCHLCISRGLILCQRNKET